MVFHLAALNAIHYSYLALSQYVVVNCGGTLNLLGGCHTDVLVKGRRDTQYGHKIFLSGGRSGMILDCVITRGNPNDAAMFPDLLTRQEAIYGRPPRPVNREWSVSSKITYLTIRSVLSN
jgi:hypothetical protein